MTTVTVTWDDDIALVEIHGYGFPARRGGPTFAAQRLGPDRIKKALSQLATNSPGSRTIAARYKDRSTT